MLNDGARTLLRTLSGRRTRKFCAACGASTRRSGRAVCKHCGGGVFSLAAPEADAGGAAASRAVASAEAFCADVEAAPRGRGERRAPLRRLDSYGAPAVPDGADGADDADGADGALDGRVATHARRRDRRRARRRELDVAQA